VMENDRVSVTARVRAAETLIPVANSELRGRIADAMEEIVVSARRHTISRRGDLVEDALELLGKIDRARAEKLRLAR
jgi:hypothetical protein